MKSSVARNSFAVLLNVTASSLLLLGFILLASCGGPGDVSYETELDGPALPDITVIYPKRGQVVGAVDSTFIFGNLGEHASDHTLLFINGLRVPVHKAGTFLAFVPVAPDTFVFRLEAAHPEETIDPMLPDDSAYALMHQTVPIEFIDQDSVMVYIPPPVRPIPIDSLAIVGDYMPPSGDRWLNGGERLEVRFQGTPGSVAWFSIPGVIDSVPMSEMPPRFQPYWGEAVFGAGAVPESLMVRGIYSGFTTVPTDTSIDSARILYHLAPMPIEQVIGLYLMPPYERIEPRVVHLLNMQRDTLLVDSSVYRVTFNDPSYPFTVRYVDSVQTVRHGPRRGYQSIFQPKGVEALAVGREGGWYRVQLSSTQYAWVDTVAVERLLHGILPPHSYLAVIRTYNNDDHLLLEFPLSGKHPFRIDEISRRQIAVRLYGVTTDTDWIRHDFSSHLIELATWWQPEDGLYEFRIELTEDVWGYDAYYQGNTFYLKLNKPPEEVGRLHGKTIVVDPGHSADPGAIGPSGMTEAEANLAISLVLRDYLEARGANVIMTRDDDSHVGLYDRPAIAVANHADLFVSVHNNALPDGVNPFVNNGTSTFYYHPHSLPLARAVHRRLVEATGLPDHGFFHGNLAVNRPTQYPAILIECAFMMIPEQEEMLRREEFRRRVAEAVTRGIEDFLEEYERGTE